MVISIVTPTYNAAKTLARTIQSVRDQDYAPIEYIVVDGGSTDGTLDIIRDHAWMIARWVSERDKGIYDAMNKGIALATGEIIGIINADDHYLPGAIRAVVDATAQNPQADVYYGDILYDCVYRPPYREQPTTQLNGAPLHAVRVSHPAVFVRRNTYERLGVYDLSYRLAGDYEFFYRLVKHGARFCYIPQTLSYMYGGGASAQGAARTLAETRKAFLQWNTSAHSRVLFDVNYTTLKLRQSLNQQAWAKPLIETYRSIRNKTIGTTQRG
jgi:glycosyltransferase involved in cell wall biosynthesis